MGEISIPNKKLTKMTETLEQYLRKRVIDQKDTDELVSQSRSKPLIIAKICIPYPLYRIYRQRPNTIF